MGTVQKILVRARGLAVVVASVGLLLACGQKGALYLPADSDFKDRATLPDLVRRQLPYAPAATPAASAASAAGARPATPASSPASR